MITTISKEMHKSKIRTVFHGKQTYICIDNIQGSQRRVPVKTIIHLGVIIPWITIDYFHGFQMAKTFKPFHREEVALEADHQ